jgi:exopolysaccharide production protein ExoY
VSAEILLQNRVEPADDPCARNTSALMIQCAFDLIVAVAAILALGPLMLVLAGLIWVGDGGPALYGHVRVGKMGQLFRCWKFRSMVVDADRILAAHLATDSDARAEWEANQKLRRDPRITSLGRFLRSSSLDELPQLWNVLAGEMSIVGPRPIVIAEINRYRSSFAAYCACRPGITGLWQVSGRNDTSYEHRVALDKRYSESRTLLMDVQIVVSTIPAVIARRGSY